MRNLLLSLLFLLFFFSSLSQFETYKTPFENGFSTGFKEGYCYGNQRVDCFTPSVPIAPLPNINESKENYTDGYNRGFQLGLDLKRIASGGGTISPQGVPYFNCTIEELKYFYAWRYINYFILLVVSPKKS